jgi:hypothetical protein
MGPFVFLRSILTARVSAASRVLRFFISLFLYSCRGIACVDALPVIFTSCLISAGVLSGIVAIALYSKRSARDRRCCYTCAQSRRISAATSQGGGGLTWMDSGPASSVTAAAVPVVRQVRQDIEYLPVRIATDSSQLGAQSLCAWA